MKKLILPAIIAFTFIAVNSSAQTIPGLPYPTETKTQKHKKNKRVIIDQDGRVIGQRQNLPPGQAKKVYGDKSAKQYAPGQRKKVNANTGLFETRRDKQYRTKVKYKNK